MKNKFFKFQLVLVLLFMSVFKMSYAQINVEQELIFYQDTLYVFNKGGQRGIGKNFSTIHFNYDSIVSNLHQCINLAMKNGKWGTIGYDNKIKVPLKYDKLIPIYRTEDMMIALKDNKWGVINTQEQTLLPFEYDRIEESGWVGNKGGPYLKFIVCKNGKYGIISHKNKIIVPIEYDIITNWTVWPYGHYVTKSGKMGFIDKKGKLLIPCSYDDVDYHYSDLKLFLVQKGNQYGLVNWHNKPFLPIVFNQLYLDIPVLLIDTIELPKAKIVAQKMDSSWHYLNIKNGSLLQANVNKDTIFKSYQRGIFEKELMRKYLQQVEKHEGATALTIDTFHRQLIDAIIATKSGIAIDFPDLHKTLIDFIPGSRQIESIFKIKNYLLALDFEVRYPGSPFDKRKKEHNLYYLMTLSGCECWVGISLYKSHGENEYKIVETLKCAMSGKKVITFDKSYDCK